MKLLNSNDVVGAIKYSKEHLSKYEDKVQFNLIQKAMGLLVFKDEDRKNQDKYKDLADEKRWKDLEDLFLKESFQLHSLTHNSMIEQSLQVGIAVLKTEFCEKKDTFNEQCPTCYSLIQKLGANLPYAHQNVTSI
mmetsp:Transcript_38533/g.36901  ORF Transcript_38533/g.36901 Transcript_38533/m.36901 type:complete len:135 (+) Transcript_38533:623-1027(+)|eukprot:CAMPEP_0170550194 /NCGR_PEP_ID=MMETSP0211-20121228/8264_1 /TAXON_ID=311385 /ORGANISM="Pseudokeronopsis sp., Strain OXSARD2" /LENGTH=134 /DNA_ID=CAMNT_0010856603 /DNA_START=607 /DNA_END=1011 /DNA_ORIENTATION=-